MRAKLIPFLICWLALPTPSPSAIAPLPPPLAPSQTINHPASGSRNNTNDTTSPLTLPVFLPYRFHIPNTDTDLRLGFGLIRRPLSGPFLQALLVVAADFIEENIERYGAYTLFPINEQHKQIFFYSLGDGISLEIQNVDWGWFVWQTLKDVVEGLRLYLVEGGRWRMCWFNVDNGDYVIATGVVGMEER